VLVLGTVVMSLGLAPVFTIGNEMIITAAPRERAGAASAVSETAAEFSGALGIAVFGSLGAVLYRLALASAMPAGVPPAIAADASATLGAAIAAGARLDAPLDEALPQAARAAFTEALRLVAGAGAAIVLLACAISLRILRRRGGPPAPLR
jgi:DHA2 family multidrug resistance protein-like MFS transporter